MPRCKNCPQNAKKIVYYNGKESNPTGKGFCAHYEKLGTKMKGRDRKTYVVAKTAKGKRWKKVEDSLKKTSPKRNKRTKRGIGLSSLKPKSVSWGEDVKGEDYEGKPQGSKMNVFIDDFLMTKKEKLDEKSEKLDDSDEIAHRNLVFDCMREFIREYINYGQEADPVDKKLSDIDKIKVSTREELKRRYHLDIDHWRSYVVGAVDKLFKGIYETEEELSERSSRREDRHVSVVEDNSEERGSYWDDIRTL